MKTLPLICLLLLIVPTLSFAAPRRYIARPARKRVIAPTVVLTPAELAAKAVLDRMASVLQKSEGIAYTADCSYATGSPAHVVMKSLTAKVVLEKTAKMTVEAYEGNTLEGIIDASGTTLTMYDANGGSYMNVSTTPDLASALDALNVAGAQVYSKPEPSSIDLHIAFDFVYLYFTGVYDITNVGPGFTLTYGMMPITVGGKTLNAVTQTLNRAGVSRTLTYDIDPMTNLPVRFSQAQGVGATPPITVLQMTFSSFKVHQALQSANAFTFVAPATAKQLTLPAPAEAPATPPAAPPASAVPPATTPSP